MLKTHMKYRKGTEANSRSRWAALHCHIKSCVTDFRCSLVRWILVMLFWWWWFFLFFYLTCTYAQNIGGKIKGVKMWVPINMISVRCIKGSKYCLSLSGEIGSKRPKSILKVPQTYSRHPGVLCLSTGVLLVSSIPNRQPYQSNQVFLWFFFEKFVFWSVNMNLE